MNRAHAISLAIALVAAGNAFADDITMDPKPFVSTASRSQVQDELTQSRRAGINIWADDYNPMVDFRSSTTRAEVTAEFLASRNAVAAFTAEDSGSSYLARMNAPIGRRGTQVARAH
jgi:hypothetical protein